MNKKEYTAEWILRVQKIAHIGIWDQDPRTDKQWWSDETFRIFGLEPQNKTPDFKAFLQMVHPDDRLLVIGKTELALKSDNNPYNIEYRIKRPDNSERIVHEEALIYRDEERKPLQIIGIIQDITDRKNFENEIIKNNETLIEAQRVAKIGSWWYDPETQIPSWTEEMYHIFGLEPKLGVLPYHEHRRIIHQEDWESFDNAVNRAVTEGIGYNLELRIARPNEEIRYINAICKADIDESGKVKQLIGTTQDITKYKEIEKTLIDYKYLIEASDDQFAVIDQKHFYQLVNDKYAEANNLSKKDIINHHIREILGDEYYEHSAKPYLDMAFDGNSQQFEVAHNYSESKKRRLLIRYYPITNDKGKIDRVAKVILDRTEQKEAEEARDRIFKFSQDLICVAGIDGYFKHLNPAWENILGYSQQELLERPFLDFIHPDDHERNDHELANLSQGKKTINFENRYICRDGSIRRFLWTATPLVDEKVVYCIGRDITERKKAEEQIQLQAETLEAIFNASPSILAIVNSELRIIKINKKGVEISGREEKEIIGLLGGEALCCIHSLIDDGCGLNPDCKDCPVRRRVMSTFHTGKPYHEEEGQITLLNNGKNTTIDMLISTSQLVVDGEICVLLSLSDITKLKQTERKNLQLESKIQQAQKMESIGNLAGGIAHDFNNILFPIIGMSEMLLEDIPPGSQEYENIEEILKAGERGSDLVKQILSFSRQSKHKLIPVHVQRVLKDVIKLMRSTIPTYIEINQDIQSDCGQVIADPTQIHQVAMNIITNAYHAVESEGGKITIKLKEIMLKGDEFKDCRLKPCKYAVLTVSDTGHGMSSDVKSRIFEPYFTTKEQGKGTGLGLATTYGIIEEHEGEIRVYSEIGKGTTFNVYLPLMEKRIVKEFVNESEKHQTGNERILLIDDEEGISKLEKQMLEKLGYKVTSHIISIEALEAFRIKPESFDLVITDMNMPNMTGFQLSKEVKKIRHDIPVIICTGFSERLERKKADEIGVNAILMKPIHQSDMAKTVRKVLDNASAKPDDNAK